MDPYAQEVVLHTQPTATGYIAAHTHNPRPRRTPAPGARGGRPLTKDSRCGRAVGTSVVGRGRAWSAAAVEFGLLRSVGQGLPPSRELLGDPGDQARSRPDPIVRAHGDPSHGTTKAPGRLCVL
ncbi:hypothetical protein GCM10010307_34120 [Streptomyces vastus]|uniref:Uncharacterized protein n=1 Tax=Streptomyces vastus TaxID=285451 RepID=A0ABP6D8Q0_9ACTN